MNHLAPTPLILPREVAPVPAPYGRTSALPPQAIQQFKELYRNRFDEELSDAEAMRRAQRFFNLYKVVFSPPRPKAASVEKKPAST